MSKRFTDTEIWADEWYQNLSPKYKLAWKYICDRADVAGIWKVNQRLMEFQVGEKVDITECLSEFNRGKSRIEQHNGSWLIVGFIKFQYGELTDKIPFHRKIKEALSSLPDTLTARVEPTLATRVEPTHREEEEVREEVREEEEKEGSKREYNQDFEAIWATYPARKGKSTAYKAYQRARKEGVTDDTIRQGLARYKAYLAHRRSNGFPGLREQDGSTWFHQQGWNDEYTVDKPKPALSYNNGMGRSEP